MKVFPIEICDAFFCEVDRHVDKRGFFEELYSQKAISNFECKQINCSVSQANIIRGLHITPFAKLVHCVQGSIFDVVADLRVDSPTYLKWFGIELTCDNRLSLYIPPNCAHGFMAKQDNTIVVYAQTDVYNSKVEKSVFFADPKLNISWPFSKHLTISKKDFMAPLC